MDFNTLNVTGLGSVQYCPDQATISFSITVLSATMENALAEHNARVRQALDTVASFHVPECGMTRYGYGPHYENRRKNDSTYENVLVGYTVHQEFSAKVRDFEGTDLPALVAALAPMTTFHGIIFTPSHREELYEDAVRSAIACARERAKNRAHELGVTLHEVVAYSESEQTPRHAVHTRGTMVVAHAAAAPSPELPIGEHEIQAFVNVTYRIQ